MKIAVLHGEIAKEAGLDEQDVLAEVALVSEGLLRLGHEPIAVPITLNLEKTKQTLTNLKPAVVFNLVESLAGKGRLIHLAPALLDALGIPYTGAGTEAMFITSNKLLAKQTLAAAELPTPAWFSETENGEIATGNEAWIIKSVWEHASLGLDEDSVIFSADRDRILEEVTARRDKLGGDCFAERFIDGREFNVSLLAKRNASIPDGKPQFPAPGMSFSPRECDPEVLPPSEIRFEAYPPEKIRVVGYRAKWVQNSLEYENTTRHFDFPQADVPLLSTIAELSLKCWRLFGLRGYARVDFRIDSTGNPWVLEVNTNPCLSPDAGFLAAAEQAKMGFADVLARIINDV